MKWKVSAVSDLGLLRSNNEDMVLVVDQLIRDSSCDMEFLPGKKNCWIAVADGMGGHNAGEVASEFVLREMAAFVDIMPAGLKSEELNAMMDALVKNVHACLNRLGSTQQEARGLGTTFSGIFFYGHEIFTIQIGDSRIYRYRGNCLVPLTRDHTLRNMLNDPTIPANQIANSFGGGAASIFFDMESLTDRIFENDVLLLCSDGLSGELTDEEIESALDQHKSCQDLVSQAKANGGKDNISCILVTIGQ